MHPRNVVLAAAMVAAGMSASLETHAEETSSPHSGNGHVTFTGITPQYVLHGIRTGVSAKARVATTDNVFTMTEAMGTTCGSPNVAYLIQATGTPLITPAGSGMDPVAAPCLNGTDAANNVCDLYDFEAGGTRNWVGLTSGAFCAGSTADTTTAVPLAAGRPGPGATGPQRTGAIRRPS